MMIKTNKLVEQISPYEPPYVIMMVGVPGSGKSTLATRLGDNLGIAVLSADQIREELSGDEANQEISRQAWEQVYQRTKQYLASNQSVIIDAVHRTAYFRRRDIALYRRYGAKKVIAVYSSIDIQTAIERNDNRSRQVPERVILDMHKSLSKDPPKEFDGFDEIIICDHT